MKIVIQIVKDILHDPDTIRLTIGIALTVFAYVLLIKRGDETFVDFYASVANNHRRIAEKAKRKEQKRNIKQNKKAPS